MRRIDEYLKAHMYAIIKGTLYEIKDKDCYVTRCLKSGDYKIIIGDMGENNLDFLGLVGVYMVSKHLSGGFYNLYYFERDSADSDEVENYDF